MPAGPAGLEEGWASGASLAVLWAWLDTNTFEILSLLNLVWNVQLPSLAQGKTKT